MSGEKREFLKTMSPEFRVSFPQVFTPKAYLQNEPKFSVVMLFDKAAQESEQFKVMKGLAKKAFIRKFGEAVWNGPKDSKGWPEGYKNPFRRGSEKSEKYEGYGDDAIFITASSKNRPGLVDEALQPIITEADFYAGCYARATINAYEFDAGANKGVAFGLNNLQKLRDGEAFSGRVKAEDEFEAVATNDGAASASENYDF